MAGRPPLFQKNRKLQLTIKTDDERMTEQAKIDAAINKPYSLKDLELIKQQELEHREGVAEGRLSPAIEIVPNSFFKQPVTIPEQSRKIFKDIKKILQTRDNVRFKIYLLGDDYIGTYKYIGKNTQLNTERFECIDDCNGGVIKGDLLELTERELFNYTFEFIYDPLRVGGIIKRYKQKTNIKKSRKSKKMKKNRKKMRSRKYK
jgi:hypothetical protein